MPAAKSSSGRAHRHEDPVAGQVVSAISPCRPVRVQEALGQLGAPGLLTLTVPVEDPEFLGGSTPGELTA
jgi:hypothetical protein